VDKLTRPFFFLSALLFHLVLFLLVASWIVFRAPVVPPPDVTLVRPPPPSSQTPPSTPGVFVNVKPPVIGGQESSDLNIPRDPDTLKIPDPGVPGLGGLSNSDGPHLPPAPIPHTGSGPSDIRIQSLIHTVRDIWQRTPQQIAEGDPTLTFPVYIASYADGDWACNTRLDSNGNIVAGSIPNLVAKISEWSHGKVNGEVVPKPLKIASHELLEKMPPFIFFTGHKDFVLTQAEVDNLREYLNDGGCIWGDNALAGEGSRFDIAFHREMKRVITDIDKNFIPYSLTDDIFAGGRYPLSQFPAGMNYYAEPPQHLDIDGIMAILYTPNDYSDMMFMRINPGDENYFMSYKPTPPGTLFTNTAFVEKRSVFYRNFDLKSSLAVHRMGMDIITYMITRFDPTLLMSH